MPRRTELSALLSGLGNVTGRDLMRAAEDRGWALDRVRGSHHIYRKQGWPVTLSIPLEAKSDGVKRGIIGSLMEEERSNG
ncbi:MAG TPA: type II toxin-antitoxin system HicA family toxin [Tepidiformaceae bacterium]|nr:type II toxin-antitoxin system HicA family toxin [Tepidiformaceae bacterium]